MTLHEQIQNEVKDAMRARDAVRVTTLKSLLSAFTNELVATKRMPNDLLPDADVLKVIKRSVNQHKDSIEQFMAGGREDLVAVEQAELTVLEAYLPQSMSRADIKVIAEAKKAELGITDKAKMGMLMGAVIKATNGAADGADVKAVVDELFS